MDHTDPSSSQDAHDGSGITPPSGDYTTGQLSRGAAGGHRDRLKNMLSMRLETKEFLVAHVREIFHSLLT